MENDSYSSICKQLDDMAMRMIRLMKEYIDAKVTLEDLIKTGSLHLAKSRYIMGNKTVSALQLPTVDSSEFTAATRVVSTSGNCDTDQLCFELSKISLKDLSEHSFKIRSRNPKNKNSSSEEQNDVHNEINIPDPLKWFGVLIPQNMREAQASFSKALEYIIQCANIQVEMDHLKNEYKLKMEQKEKLKEKEGS